MKRAIIHIGPHKTGSTYIQNMMKANAFLFPATHYPYPKTEPLFEALQRTTLSIHDEADLPERLPLISDMCAEIASMLTAENTLFSSEDLLGPMPTMAGISGLYPFATQTIPTIKAAFEEEGVEVQFFCYVREMTDWVRSVHAHKFRGRKRTFAPRKFMDRNGLPDNWSDFIGRLQISMSSTAIVHRSYEADAVSGRLGADLFRHFGLSDDILDQMEWLPPANVSRRLA